MASNLEIVTTENGSHAVTSFTTGKITPKPQTFEQQVKHHRWAMFENLLNTAIRFSELGDKTKANEFLNKAERAEKILKQIRKSH